MFGFWTGGHRAYRRSLDAEYRDKLKSLRANMRSAKTLADRNACKVEIRKLKSGYRAKRRAMKWSWFSTSV